MANSKKNIITILGVLTIVWGGYYLYSSQVSSTDALIADTQLQEMYTNTQVFIERRQILDQTNINSSLLEDTRFLSLRSHSEPLQESPIGKSDPFSAPSSITSTEIGD